MSESTKHADIITYHFSYEIVIKNQEKAQLVLGVVLDSNKQFRIEKLGHKNRILQKIFFLNLITKSLACLRVVFPENEADTVNTFHRSVART